MALAIRISPRCTNTPSTRQFIHLIICCDSLNFGCGSRNFLTKFVFHLKINLLSLLTQSFDHTLGILQTFTGNIHFQFTNTKIKFKIKTRVNDLSNKTLPRINICFLESTIPLGNMIWLILLLLSNNLSGLNRICDITHDSNNTTINTLIVVGIVLSVVIQSANSPTITTNNNISIAILMILQIISKSTLNDGFHSEIMENPDSLVGKLSKIIVLNSKTNLKTISLVSFASIKKIQSRNTAVINSGNIGILSSIKIRTGSKTLGISKRTFTAKTKTTYKIVAIILIRSTVSCIQVLHIALTKPSAIITHCKRRISRCWQDHLEGILIASTNMTVISISRQFTNNCHYLIGIKRVRKDFKHFASLSDCKTRLATNTSTMSLNNAICQLHLISPNVL